MENALLNAAYYAVEFIKVWLATSGLLRIKMKKSVYYGFVLSVIEIGRASCTERV